MNLILPKKDENGEYFISFSQVSLWREAKGFDTGFPGYQEYIRKYFLGETFENNTGYAEFGTEVENYICSREDSDKFTDDEKAVLEKITPLGVFQKEIKLYFKEYGFYVKGFIDDCTEDLTRVRDYKTASSKSKEKYYQQDYRQLDLYALAIKEETGVLPSQVEVVCIERLGNGFKGGRNALTVGKEIWYIDKVVNEQRIKEVKDYIITSAIEISEYWKVFCKLNND